MCICADINSHILSSPLGLRIWAHMDVGEKVKDNSFYNSFSILTGQKKSFSTTNKK